MTTKAETAVERFLRDRKLESNPDNDNENSLSYLKAVYAEPPQRTSRENFPRAMIRQISGRFEERGVNDPMIQQDAIVNIIIYVRVDNKPGWTFWDGTTIPAVRAGTTIAEHIAKLLMDYRNDIPLSNENKVFFNGVGDISQPPAPGIVELDNTQVYETRLQTEWNVWIN